MNSVHVDEKMFQCDLCYMKFSRNDHLQKHQRKSCKGKPDPKAIPDWMQPGMVSIDISIIFQFIKLFIFLRGTLITHDSRFLEIQGHPVIVLAKKRRSRLTPCKKGTLPPFFSFFLGEESEREYLVSNGIDRFWRLGHSFDVSVRKELLLLGLSLV